jgi:hypothetical protein
VAPRLPLPRLPALRLVLRVVLAGLIVAACGRPLTDTEIAFANAIHGDGLDLTRVRLVEGAPVGSVTFRRKPRPRVACRELILPPAYPDRLYLIEAMLLAHELTHVWQWQNRKTTGYSPWRAAAEHGTSDDPYLFDLDGAPDFLSYGFEQQGAIVEEYVCCRALAPEAARTRRLHGMLKAAFPVSDLPARRDSDVYLPWKQAELRGICD